MNIYDVCEVTKEQVLNSTPQEVGAFAVRLARVDAKVKGVAGSIGEWVHSIGHIAQRESIKAHGEGEEANKEALGNFLSQIRLAEMGAADEYGSEFDLKKHAGALDSATRKLTYALEHGCNLAEESSTNKVQTWNKEHREGAEKAKKDEAFRDWCKSKGIDPDKQGPKGSINGGKEDLEQLSDLQVGCARLAQMLEELSELGAKDEAEEKLAGLEKRVATRLQELKSSVGARIAG
jgi:hypothetical protein